VSATIVMAVAVLLYVLVRWSKDEPAVTIGSVLSGVLVIGVIALADRGRTAEVARGFAWLFFVVVAYNFVPAMTKAMSAAASAAKGNVHDTLT
jgi:hypothetical protein